MLTWNSRRVLDNNYLLFIGVSFLFSGAMDLAHILAYKGVGVFQISDANLAAQLWIAFRYVFAVSFLIAPAYVNRKINLNIALIGYSSVTVLAFGSIFYWKLFPACFVENTGLTPFKIASEYIISLIFLAALVLLLKKRASFDRRVLKLLSLSLLSSIFSELFFTQYVNVYSLSNMAGHYLEVISFYFIYKAIIETGITEPYNLLFRNLMQSKDALKKAHAELEIRIKERTADITNELLERIFSITHVMVAFMDSSFTFIRVNRAYAEADGREPEFYVGKNHFALFPYVENEKIFRRVVETGEPHFAFEMAFEYAEHPERGETYRDWSLLPVKDADGKVSGLLLTLIDVTDKKRAEEKLSVFTNLINQSSDAIFIVDPETAAILDINDSACTGLGYGREELLSMKVIDFSLNQPDHSRWKEHVREVIEKSHIILEDRLWRKNGTSFPVEASIKHITYGEKSYLIGIVRDITERKEEASRTYATNTILNLFSQTYSRKEYLDAVVEMLSEWSDCRCVGIRILDEYGNIPYESYKGFSKEFRDMENHLSVKKDRCACIRVINGEYDPLDVPLLSEGGSFYSGNTLTFINSLTEDEKKRYRGLCIKSGFLSLAIIPIRCHNKTIGAIHMADEREGILSRKRIEFIEMTAPLIGEAVCRFAAEEDRARLMAAVESVPDAIVITDAETTIRYVNPAFEHITGYSRNEIIGQSLNILRSNNHTDASYEEISDAIKQGRVWSGRLTSRKKDGTTYEEDITLSPVKDSSGNIHNYVAIKRDVTEKLRLESIAEAVNTMNSIGYVFSGIRHEIGNYINSIKMTLSILKKNLDSYDKTRIMEYIERALSESARVEYLLKTFKTFNMYESPELQNVNIQSFMDKFLALIRGDISVKKRIGIISHIEPNAEFFYADPRALQQVFLNVITNAADACEGREQPKIEITVSKLSGMILFKIRDNGRGMTEEQMKDIFKPFYTTKPQGLGLGLVLTKKMLSKMNGIIEVLSRKDVGTTVDIFIPEGKNGD